MPCELPLYNRPRQTQQTPTHPPHTASPTCLFVAVFMRFSLHRPCRTTGWSAACEWRRCARATLSPRVHPEWSNTTPLGCCVKTLRRPVGVDRDAALRDVSPDD